MKFKVMDLLPLFKSINTIIYINYKKVLLRERKRHTARRVAHTSTATRKGVWTDTQSENITLPHTSGSRGNKNFTVVSK